MQVAFGKRRANRVSKPAAGHFAKAGVEAGRVLREFRVTPEQAASLKPGGVVGVDIFQVGQKVDVTGVSHGKGFAGVIKRHHFSSNRASHGNSVSHNKPGSISMAQDPGRVFPGKKMPGHLGAVQAHRAEPRDRAHRRRAPAAADPRRRSRLAQDGDLMVSPTKRATSASAAKPARSAAAAAAK